MPYQYRAPMLDKKDKKTRVLSLSVRWCSAHGRFSLAIQLTGEMVWCVVPDRKLMVPYSKLYETQSSAFTKS